MYHKFDYKFKSSTLITFTRWLPLRKKIDKEVERNKPISVELRISFSTKFENLLINFFYYPKDALLMYVKFDYKLQK